MQMHSQFFHFAERSKFIVLDGSIYRERERDMKASRRILRMHPQLQQHLWCNAFRPRGAKIAAIKVGKQNEKERDEVPFYRAHERKLI